MGCDRRLLEAAPGADDPQILRRQPARADDPDRRQRQGDGIVGQHPRPVYRANLDTRAIALIAGLSLG